MKSVIASSSSWADEPAHAALPRSAARERRFTCFQIGAWALPGGPGMGTVNRSAMPSFKGAPTLQGVLLLGLIVLIQSFLSMALKVN